MIFSLDFVNLCGTMNKRRLK